MPIISRARVLLRLHCVADRSGVAALAACDSKSARRRRPGGTPRQVTVVGTGKVDGTPDTLTANAAISFVASDVTTAMNQTNDRQQAVIDALVNAGVDRKDISTTNVSLQPSTAPTAPPSSATRPATRSTSRSATSVPRRGCWR